MEKGNGLGVKKGAWSKEEDDLLKKCVQHFGEGRWHLVPFRAGLNRCRKSCRLRWMNYLRPDITRGDFTEAEVDLMTRLHKLLGNRWSLIAGRIPGRTANDIKNFWNTRMDKKSEGDQIKGQPIQKTITKTNIIRPRPHICTNSMIQEGQVIIDSVADHEKESNNPNNNDDDKLQRSFSIIESLPSSSQEADKCIHWWSNLLDATENKLETNILFLDDKGKEEGLWTGQTNPAGLMNELKTPDFDFEV